MVIIIMYNSNNGNNYNVYSSQMESMGAPHLLNEAFRGPRAGWLKQRKVQGDSLQLASYFSTSGPLVRKVGGCWRLLGVFGGFLGLLPCEGKKAEDHLTSALSLRLGKISHQCQCRSSWARSLCAVTGPPPDVWTSPRPEVFPMKRQMVTPLPQFHLYAGDPWTSISPKPSRTLGG